MGSGRFAFSIFDFEILSRKPLFVARMIGSSTQHHQRRHLSAQKHRAQYFVWTELPVLGKPNNRATGNFFESAKTPLPRRCHLVCEDPPSLLEVEEVEPTQDLSSLITTLQQELSSDSIFDPLSFPSSKSDPKNPSTATATLEDQTSSSSSFYSSSSPSTLLLKEDEDQEDDKERVIRHLLEASDDELGIPNREVGVVYDGDIDGFNGGDGLSLCDGLWELEDEAANYYTLLQSELFM
ncbi:hypothetical protein I3760_05G212000 [Carya illinoinensis]|nr:hypothetical protein I3760_05G212000 [Carya illinoinensis]